MSAEGVAGHTPGPWAARREFSSLCIVDEGGDYIADIHDRETYDENLEVEDEEASNAEAAANAHLIAAAPELLEALEAQREASAFAAQVSEITPDGEPVAKHLMDKADLLFARAERLRAAAIAKARGGQ